MQKIPYFDELIAKKQLPESEAMKFLLNVYCRCLSEDRYEADDLEYIHIGNDVYVNDRMLGDAVDALGELGVKAFTLTQHSTALLREMSVIQKHGWRIAGIVNVLEEKFLRGSFMSKFDDEDDKSMDYTPAVLFVHE